MPAVRDLYANPVLKVAVDLGWQPFGFNTSARRHFHWFLPDDDRNPRPVREQKGV